MIELVFIGMDMDQKAIIRALDRCLLTADELAGHWTHLPDPLPAGNLTVETVVMEENEKCV